MALSEFSLLVKLPHWVTASHNNDGMCQAIMICLGRQCGQSNGKWFDQLLFIDLLYCL